MGTCYSLQKKQPKKPKQQKQQKNPNQQDQEEQEKQQQLLMIKSLVDVKKQVEEVLNVLGLLSSSTYSEVLRQLKDKALKRAGLVEDDVAKLIEARAEARRNKEFSKSDQIRADLTAKGIALMDVGKETIWRPCVPVDQQQAPLASS